MNNYKNMIEDARRSGVATEDKMWKSISAVQSLLEDIDDPSLLEMFMRKQHEILYGHHYDERTAESDIKHISFTDRNGAKHIGHHWNVEEVENALRSKHINSSITKWDKYVAANTMYADLCCVLNDEQILDAAYSFFLNDEDWVNKDCKIWDYYSSKNWFETRVVD